MASSCRSNVTRVAFRNVIVRGYTVYIYLSSFLVILVSLSLFLAHSSRSCRCCAFVASRSSKRKGKSCILLSAARGPRELVAFVRETTKHRLIFSLSSSLCLALSLCTGNDEMGLTHICLGAVQTCREYF